MKINNAQAHFFETKENYLKFRQSWKNFFKDGKHAKEEKEDCYGQKCRKSNLTCTHHLIYALLRGRDIRTSFSSNTKVNGQHPYHAFNEAKNCIIMAVLISINGKYNNKNRHIDGLLCPFNGTVTFDQMAELSELIKDWSFDNE